MQNWPFFKADELRCKCGNCDGGTMNKFFMRRLISVREDLGFPLILSSGYRCPAHNAKESSTGLTGPHTTGRAVDIQVYGHRAMLLAQAAYRYGIVGVNHGGLGISQKGPYAKRFLHLDDLTAQDIAGPRPWVWSY